MKRKAAVQNAVRPAAVDAGAFALAPRLKGTPEDVARAIRDELAAHAPSAKERIKKRLRSLHPMD
ncbi:MAG: hypothetical protein ACK4N5_06275 [Myxococcales bacterium]